MLLIELLIQWLQDAELELERVSIAMHELEKQLQQEQDLRIDVVRKLQVLARLCHGFKSTVNQGFTRLANYQHRVTLMVGHVQSVTGMAECIIGPIKERLHPLYIIPHPNYVESVWHCLPSKFEFRGHMHKYLFQHFKRGVGLFIILRYI